MPQRKRPSRHDQLAPRDQAKLPAGVVQVHHGKDTAKPHFIPEWAEKRGKSQADFVNDGVADKSVVSRWFSKEVFPSRKARQVAEYLDLRDATGEVDVEALMHHPDYYPAIRIMRGLNAEERERAITLWETAFPRKDRAGGA